MKTNICFTSLCLMLCICLSSVAQNSTLKSSGYAPVNGQKIYYEIHGQGKPLILLHGAYVTIGMNWGQFIPELSKTHQVIALEMQGHGHTSLGNRPYSYEALADDVAKTMSYLKVDSADVVGYSFGGTIAYQLAIKNPQLVKKMIIISSTYKLMGWQKEVRDMLQNMKPGFLDGTPLKAEYVKVAPDSTEWKRFNEKMIALDKQDYNLGDQHISSIKLPVLLIAGDNDGIDKPVLMDTYKRLGGCGFADITGTPKSQLAILPGHGHVSLIMQTDELLRLISNFLK